MRWKTGRRSSHVEDRRGTRTGGGLFKGGIGTVVIALGLAYFLGVDPRIMLQLGEAVAPSGTTETDYQPTAK